MLKHRVAVIGAAGQVGSVLIRRLKALEKIDLVAVCRNVVSAGLVHFSCPDCDIRVGSVSEKESTKQLLGDCDIVINCALSMGGGSPRISRISNKRIIDGLLALEKLQTLIHFSSISVYGDFIGGRRARASAFGKPKPDNEYGRSKLEVEEFAKRMCKRKGVRYYCLRLGHVIGAGTDRSKQIAEFSKSDWFMLPFGGSLASNTIHVENLASLILGLIDATISEGIYNVADQGMSWRMVFDWHTATLGLPPVREMPLKASDSMRSFYAHRSVIHDFAGWLRGLPLNSLVRSPAIFDLALRFLIRVPESVTDYLANVSRRTGAAKQISALDDNSNYPLSPVYLSDAMPGTYLRLPNGNNISEVAEGKLSEDLRKWYERFSGRTLL